VCVGDFFPLYTGGTAGAYNGAPGFNQHKIIIQYRWEQSKLLTLGFVRFLNNRVRLSVDAYIKTTDLILNVPIPATNGFTVLTANAGSMENKGLEFEFIYFKC
jgi:outer membrane receptor protein involved in Fe transport